MDSERSESDRTNTTSSFSDCTQNAVAIPVCKAPSSQHDVYSTENIITLEQDLWREINHLRNQVQKAEQEIKALCGENVQLYNQEQTLRGENVQLYNQEQTLRGENVQLYNQVQQSGQVINTLRGENVQLHNQVQQSGQVINTLGEKNGQLHNQVQTFRGEIYHLCNQVQELEQEIKVQSASYEERLRKLSQNAEEQLNAAGSVVNSQGLVIATRDDTIRCLMHELHQVSFQRSLLEKQLVTLSENIRNHVQQIPSWVISREEVLIRKNDTLGQGGWGVVHKGTFRCDQVAVKQLHKLSPEHRKLFEREMEIMSQCRHPNLLLLIGATNDQESPLLVMERLHCSLRDLIEEYRKRDSQLDKNLITILALGVAKGLCYLHGKTPPIIHRDLKSDNVLLEKHADSWKPKLSDYGTANFCSDNMTPNQGTVVYAAPEAWTANLQTPKMDVYSFGWLVYEMCTGNRPGPRNLIQQQIELISSTALKELVYACIQDNPVQRPTMEEVTNFLMKGLGNTNA